MPQREFISRFSPNRTDPEILEKIFVQRQDLLEQSVAALRESALTKNKHHLLFVGPRGCGKTHLLALIVHRLQQQADLADRLRVAWLNEDETSLSFLDLLLRIYRALSDRYLNEFPREDLRKLYGQDREEAQNALTQDLIKRIGKRTLLVLVENLDALFDQLEDSEQRTWRAFIQNHPIFATAATAQSLFAGVSQREQPFFGFFDTRHLRPLTVEEATELLQRIARLNDDSELTQFLSTPRGRARVHSIHHLSGGNPRLYIVLSDFITRDTLDELVRPFEEMVDEQLTPYYQERLRWLSPLQRKIVEFLCFRPGPVAVKSIADRLFTEHGSITSQLKKLREMGYVTSNPRGRESLYELAEPLMRLSMQVKDTRDHQPLDLIVDFLRIWYDREELKQKLSKTTATTPSRKYLAAALEKLGAGQPNLFQQLLRTDLEGVDVERCDDEQFEKLRVLAEESDTVPDWLNFAQACHCRQRHPEAAEILTRIIDSPETPVEQLACALSNRGVTFTRWGKTEMALSDYSQLVALPNAPTSFVAKALFNRARIYGDMGRTEEAIADYSSLIETPGAPLGLVTKALFNRGYVLGRTGSVDLEIKDYTRLIESAHSPVDAVAKSLNNRGLALRLSGQHGSAFADFTRVISLAGAPAAEVARALNNRGAMNADADRNQEAIADYTAALSVPDALGPYLSLPLLNRASALATAGMAIEAIADYQRVIETPHATPEHVAMALLGRATFLQTTGRVKEALADLSRLIDLPAAPIQQIATALNKRGYLHATANRLEAALADFTRVSELPGVPAVQLGWALFNRGHALGQIGKTNEELASYARVTQVEGASIESIAMALCNRGAALAEQGNLEEAIHDFSRATELVGAPAEVVSIALNNRGQALLETGHPGEAISDHARVLTLPGANSDEIDRATRCLGAIGRAVIRGVLGEMNSPNIWQARAATAILLYAERNCLPHLGNALVRHLSELARSPLGSAGLDLWLTAWESAASEHAELRLPLRLLHVGIAYLKTEPRDETVLLDLPKEERLLVRRVLGLPEQRE